VADISGDTRATSDVIEGELGDARVELEEEGERLADTTAGTENNNLGELDGGTISMVSQCFLANGAIAAISAERLFVLLGCALTLLADAEKARRWTAPEMDCETFWAANILKMCDDGIRTEDGEKVGV
jgi:hypothetical protein